MTSEQARECCIRNICNKTRYIILEEVSSLIALNKTEIAQYGPYYLPFNVFTACKGCNFYILFGTVNIPKVLVKHSTSITKVSCYVKEDANTGSINGHKVDKSIRT